MDEKIYYLGFSVFPGVGPVTFGKLLAHFGSAKAAWEASHDAFEHVCGKVLGEKFAVFKETFSFGEYNKRLAKANARFVTLQDKEYPKQLARIPKAPFVLFVKGDLFCFRGLAPKIAVVGARSVTQYGREVTELFTRDLARSGCVIVSGLAIGVDAIAHQTTLDHGGKTIAVLGCGVDYCAPSENQGLYERILENGGLIISEFPLGQTPTKGSFPARNRIIAGLSEAVLVTEGAGDSGSLITAAFAHDFGRKVFAVPGPITSSMSKGPYALIAKGAILVTDTQQLLLAIGKEGLAKEKQRKRKKGDTKEEEKILRLLEIESLTFDELIRKIHISSSQLASLLSMMEIKGLIGAKKDGQYYIVS